MRIAQVSPLIESVPPQTYGGIERVVSNLTESLVKKGHDVTLFASGDSKTTANLYAVVEQSLRLSQTPRDPEIAQIIQLEKLIQMRDRFDIIHFHIETIHFPLVRHLDIPHVTTLHSRLDRPDVISLYQEFQEVPVVSISDAQRRFIPDANWVSTVYNGIPVNENFNDSPGDYLLFLGRFCPDKGPEEAIDIALKSNFRLKMAAKVDASDKAYFESRIAPLLEHPLIEYLGEVGEPEKSELICGARALLFPIKWPEPFGLVMTEAMACGTPVIAFMEGSVPEVVKPGVSGFIVETVQEAVAAVSKISQLDRRLCRKYFENRFTCQHMAKGYLQTYQNVLTEWKRKVNPGHRAMKNQEHSSTATQPVISKGIAFQK
ncbi:GDP-mannose-dependent alpha-(1-2)-phosphatidylinositol mannosyltransferase [Gimesia maris]|uniref:glycosyltransferase family 4 protein n=1 Tax=Gimesia maris TaxID=122 RepID=UPI00118BA458|nr:glycosyltransferase family 4 protein [Gimesia maris]QDU14091.1 GDP-mannose-dependent alpha-(1-2)-phosphatidylinositol mannosyltransferase [Gimesia maris]